MLALLRAKPFKDVTVGSILGGLLAVCLVTLGILYWRTAPHRRQAQALLHDLSELKLGTSTLADAERLAKQYGGIPWYVTPTDMRCTFQRCELAFEFDNMPLSYVPGVGYTRFLALVDLKNGIVVGREINYERVGWGGRDFHYVISDSESPPPKGWAYGVWRLKVDPRTLMASHT